jgi:hypothetical protein
MSDNGQAIQIELNTSPVQTDEELKSNNRFILGYLSAKYNTDADITATIYARLADDMSWQNVATLTLSSTKKRYFGQLPQGLTVIDYYVSLTAKPVNVFEITSLKILMKTLPTGKFG